MNAMNKTSKNAKTFADMLPDTKVKYLESGRIIYRHNSNKGSVLVFNMFGRKVKLFVADAKYRTTAKWGTAGKDYGMTKYTEYTTTYLNPENLPDNEKELFLLYTMTDAELRKNHRFLAKCSVNRESAKYNTDKMMEHADTEAAHKCREVTVDGLGSLDLPNLYELMVIYLESDAIDLLDPTVIPNSKNGGWNDMALGCFAPNGRWNFNGAQCLAASCEETSNLCRVLFWCGALGQISKSANVGVCPVKEL